jgi:hypothetical protein
MKKILMKTIFVLFIILTLTSCDKETNTKEKDSSLYEELKWALQGASLWGDHETIYLETKDTTYFGDFDIYLNDELILDSKDYNYCIPAQTSIEVDVDLDANKGYNYKTVVGKKFVWMDADKDWGISNTSTLKLNDGDVQQIYGETNYMHGLTKVDLKKGKNILVFPQRQDVYDIYNKSSNFSITEKYCDGDKEVDFNVAYCELTTTKDYGMQTGDLKANCYGVSYVVQGYNTNEVISVDASHEVYTTDYPTFDMQLCCSQKVIDTYGYDANDTKYYYKVTFPKDVKVIVSKEDYIISSDNNEFVVNAKYCIDFKVKGINDFGTNVTFKIQRCYCD